MDELKAIDNTQNALPITNISTEALLPKEPSSRISLPKIGKEKEDSKKKVKKIQCSICLSKVQDYKTLDWGHKYCEEWIVTHFTYQIKSKVLISTCPDCFMPLSESFVKPLLKEEVQNMLEEFKHQREVDMDPTLYWCPRTNCGKYVQILGVKKGTKHKATCECGYSFCIQCHELWHGSKSCKKAKDKGLRIFQK